MKPRREHTWVHKGVYTSKVGIRGHGWSESYAIESSLEHRPKGMPPRDFIWLRAEYMCYLREQGLSDREIGKRVGVSTENAALAIERHGKELRNMALRYGHLLTDIAT